MKIARMTRGSWGKIVAFFDVELSGMTVKGFKLISGQDGLFVGVPSIKKEDGTYDNTVFVEKEKMPMLNQIATMEYDKVPNQG